MTIHVLNFTLMLTDLIRKARRSGAIDEQDANFLISIAHHSRPAETTRALVHARELPDFLYAALYFSTLVWQSCEAADNDEQARAGFMLARFVLAQESPGYDAYWAAKLLREFYDAHDSAAQDAVGCVA